MFETIKLKSKKLKSLAQRFTIEKAINKIRLEAKKFSNKIKLGTKKYNSISKKYINIAEWKKDTAALFPHWYYTTDLGDGISRKATINNEEVTMPLLIKNRSNLLYMIDKHVGDISGLKILDLACSAGLHAFELARRGAIVTGIDWDSGAIKQAKFVQECLKKEIKHPIKFEHVSLFDFECPTNYFDYVYCSGLFYHLPDPIGAAQKMRTFCSKGIMISSSVSPKEEALFELSDPKMFPFCASWEFALVPTAKMLEKIIEHAGFKIVASAIWDQIPETVKPFGPASTGPVFLIAKT